MPPKIRMSRQARQYYKNVKSTAAKKLAAAVLSKRKSRRPTSKRVTKTFKSKVIKVMDQVGEHKIKSITNQYAIAPSPQTAPPGLSVVYYKNYIIGSQPSDWTGPTGAANYTALNGVDFTQGVTSDQRIGKYMYLKHATLNLRVNLLNLTRVGCPVKFRVIVYKTNRSGSLNTQPGNPNSDLFIESNGQEVGVNSVATDDNASMRFMTAITNRKKYNIFKDMSFILQPSFNSIQGQTAPVAMSHGIYPAEKYMRLSLPFNERVEYSNTTNQPKDSKNQYAISVFSAPVGTHDARPSDWKTSVTGTVSALDN